MVGKGSVGQPLTGGYLNLPGIWQEVQCKRLLFSGHIWSQMEI